MEAGTGDEITNIRLSESANTLHRDISTHGGHAFVGNPVFNAETISFTTKRKRSDENFKNFNEHYDVPNNVSAHFTGRADVLAELDKKMLPIAPGSKEPLVGVQRRFVLCGLGGSGKTQIALRFAENNREKFWGIFWVDATNDDTAQISFVDIAKTARLVDQNLNSAKRWLSNSHKPWLLIIDNADDPEMHLSKYFPAGDRGVILVTTRNTDHSSLGTAGWSKIDEMPEEDAIQLLLRGVSNVIPEIVDNNVDSARNIVNTLGCIPLAIAQAAGTIRQGICSLEQYCDVFSKKRKYLMERKAGDESSNYEYTTYASWEISVNFLESRTGDTAEFALNLLNLLSNLHFTGLAEETFAEVWSKVGVPLERDIEEGINSESLLSRYPYEEDLKKILFKGWGVTEFNTPVLIFREAVSLLSSFSLVQSMTYRESFTFSMHPMVHFWARDRLSDSTRTQWQRLAVQFVDAIALNGMHWLQKKSRTFNIISSLEPLQYRMRRAMLPHIEAILSHVDIATIFGYQLRSIPPYTFARIYLENDEPEKTLALLSDIEKINGVGFDHVDMNRLEHMMVRATAMLQTGEVLTVLEMLFNWARVPTDHEYGKGFGAMFVLILREVHLSQDPAVDFHFNEFKDLENAIETLLSISRHYVQVSKSQSSEMQLEAAFISIHMKTTVLELYVLNELHENALILMAELILDYEEIESRGQYVLTVNKQRFTHVACVGIWRAGLKSRRAVVKSNGIQLAEILVEERMNCAGPDHILTLQALQIVDLMKRDQDIPRELWIHRFIF